MLCKCNLSVLAKPSEKPILMSLHDLKMTKIWKTYDMRMMPIDLN